MRFLEPVEVGAEDHLHIHRRAVARELSQRAVRPFQGLLVSPAAVWAKAIPQVKRWPRGSSGLSRITRSKASIAGSGRFLTVRCESARHPGVRGVGIKRHGSIESARPAGNIAAEQ